MSKSSRGVRGKMYSKPNQVHQVVSTLCWKIKQVLFWLFCFKDYSMLHACFSFSVSGSNGKGYPRSKPRWSCVQRCAEYSHPNYWHWASKDLNLCCEGSDETSSDVFCKEMIVDTSRTKQHAKMSVKSVNVRRECKFCIWPGPCEIKMCCWSFGSGFLYRSLHCAKS